MNDIKIAHEAPLSLMSFVKRMTDYDYALVHLFEKEGFGMPYFFFFQDSLKEGREVILDNSLYELKEAFDPLNYSKYIEVLEPTWYVIPDAWHDAEATVRKAQEWKEKYSASLPSKTIGVVQGKTYGELLFCYKEMLPLCDMIAISFSYPFYLEGRNMISDTYMQYTGRQEFLRKLSHEDCFDKEKPIHLLGCSLPQEFIEYQSTDLNIHSIDTSNPVAAGLECRRYKNWGLGEKPSTIISLEDRKNYDISQICSVAYNIAMFRSFLKK